MERIPKTDIILPAFARWRKGRSRFTVQRRDLPEAKGDDLMAIMTAGAYGAVMASAYNARPPAPEVLVHGREWSVVRPRMSLEALIALDRFPGWLGN